MNNLESLFNSVVQDINTLCLSTARPKTEEPLIVAVALRVIGAACVVGAAVTLLGGVTSLATGSVAGIGVLITSVFLGVLGHDLLVIGENISQINKAETNRSAIPLICLGAQAFFANVKDCLNGKTTSFLDEERIAKRMIFADTLIFKRFI